MSGKDIFLSYASGDRHRIGPLVRALEESGWTVFWDRTIPTGKTWRQVIGAELRDCRSVVVVWSKPSVESEFVQEEAEQGKRKGALFPVRIDDVEPPFGFSAIQAADLLGWDGTTSTPAVRRFIQDITARLGEPPRSTLEPLQADAGVKGQRATDRHAIRSASDDVAPSGLDLELQRKRAEKEGKLRVVLLRRLLQAQLTCIGGATVALGLEMAVALGFWLGLWQDPSAYLGRVVFLVAFWLEALLLPVGVVLFRLAPNRRSRWQALAPLFLLLLHPSSVELAQSALGGQWHLFWIPEAVVTSLAGGAFFSVNGYLLLRRMSPEHRG